MSLSSAFGNALSGLNASAVRAELVSTNIANAMTEGYARRDVSLSSVVVGGNGGSGGVQVSDVERAENAIATATRRGSGAEYSNQSIQANTLAQITTALGDLGAHGSLGQQFVELESSLLAASNDPSSGSALTNVVSRAQDIAVTLNRLSLNNNQMRQDADEAINRQVETLNSALSEIKDLNVEIRRITNSSGDTSSLFDKRDSLISQVNDIVPVNVMRREHDQVALFSPTGGILLDGQPAQFSFAPTGTITHNLTLGGGALSPLMVNGTAVQMNAHPSFYDGGSLSALFAKRDVEVPQFGDRIDALAADLVERFQTPTVDPTLAATDPGLFTDAGGFFTAASQPGLAGRISLNVAVDPAVGGAAWRLRDGFNAVAQGQIGNNAQLVSKLNAFGAQVTPNPGLSITTPMSAAGFANEISADYRFQEVAASDKSVYLNSKLNGLKEVEANVTGVDIDQQVQQLMEIEKAYAANARVMSVLDELIDRLMEI